MRTLILTIMVCISISYGLKAIMATKDNLSAHTEQVNKAVVAMNNVIRR